MIEIGGTYKRSNALLQCLEARRFPPGPGEVRLDFRKDSERRPDDRNRWDIQDRMLFCSAWKHAGRGESCQRREWRHSLLASPLPDKDADDATEDAVLLAATAAAAAEAALPQSFSRE